MTIEDEANESPFARFVFDPAVRFKSSLGSQVYLELLERIQRGELSSDDRIVDTTLAAELSVSRMPVREALLRLSHEGYLVSTTRGFMLPKLSHRDVAQIYEIRLLLEPRAAASAAQVISDRTLALMEEAQQGMRTAAAGRDMKALIPKLISFRQLWLRTVPNPRLAATIARFIDQVQTVQNGTLHNEAALAEALQLSSDLLQAFKKRDALAVQDLMTINLNRGREQFFLLSPGSDAGVGRASESSEV